MTTIGSFNFANDFLQQIPSLRFQVLINIPNIDGTNSRR